MTDIVKVLSKELNIKEWQVKNTIDLIDAGNTIPFIARYRKEATGELDELHKNNVIVNSIGDISVFIKSCSNIYVFF